jgi:hypothetical protein
MSAYAAAVVCLAAPTALGGAKGQAASATVLGSGADSLKVLDPKRPIRETDIGCASNFPVFGS